ncbi:MAG: hypothetical protein ACHREM_24075 [Polyangiales bacterium]
MARGTELSDWGSLLADLARHAPSPDAPVEWRIHDKTHLEAALDLPVASEPKRYRWEAYFFVPESFRLDSATYDKKAIYEDLHSYVRLSLAPTTLEQLARLEPGASLFLLRAAMAEAVGRLGADPRVELASRHLRLFASRVRAGAIDDMRALRARLASGDSAACVAEIERFVVDVRGIVVAFRGVAAELDDAPMAEDLRVASRWVDEDISLVLESVCASLGLDLQRLAASGGADADRLLAPTRALAETATLEARHRAMRGYSSIARAGATPRELEQLEWRRHMLKRFTSSVLWLRFEVRQGAGWVSQTLYALAAAIAMSFAFAASTQSSMMGEHVFRYATLDIVSYALKDRIKATLQNVFSRWIDRRFPDRRWTIRDRERSRDVGTVHERAGFVEWAGLPSEVLGLRRRTREHAIEEHARPEKVLWHDKRFDISPVAGKGDAEAPMLTEIFRLNLKQWLEHTDDPKRRVAFADPADGRLHAMTARRVYNISVVYRLAPEDAHGDRSGAWHRVRLVVSRKGIERLDPIV